MLCKEAQNPRSHRTQTSRVLFIRMMTKRGWSVSADVGSIGVFLKYTYHSLPRGFLAFLDHSTFVFGLKCSSLLYDNRGLRMTLRDPTQKAGFSRWKDVPNTSTPRSSSLSAECMVTYGLRSTNERIGIPTLSELDADGWTSRPRMLACIRSAADSGEESWELRRIFPEPPLPEDRWSSR